MEKETLRNLLFSKYFINDNGILISDIVNKLSFIKEVYKKLNLMCEKNIDLFSFASNVENMKLLKNKNKEYLILKLMIEDYIIIDLENKRNITQEEFIKDFNLDFFIQNFNEKIDILDFYIIEKYNGDINELLDFYYKNKDVLELSNKIYYKIKIDNAYTYIHIDFTNALVQLSFESENQFLYEQIYFNYDLTLSGLQDVKNKISKEELEKIIIKIKEIKIPKENIPIDLYNICNVSINQKKLIK